MDDDLANRWIRHAYKLGYHAGQSDKYFEQLHHDHLVVRNARIQAWMKHDSDKVRLAKNGKDITLPDEWPPGLNEGEEIERYVRDNYPESQKFYGDDYDDRDL